VQWAVEQAHTASNSPVVQVLVIVIAALVISIIGYVFKRNRSMYNDVHEIKDVLITPKPTSLNPNPPKGLIAVVADHTTTLAVLLAGTKELVADKAQNDGSTSRDALNRIEKEQVRVAENLARDEHDNEQKGL
jgi:hypothetical protein